MYASLNPFIVLKTLRKIKIMINESLTHDSKDSLRDECQRILLAFYAEINVSVRLFFTQVNSMRTFVCNAQKGEK
jgi:hypothetical protein